MGPVTDEDLSDTTAMAPHNRVIVRQCEAAGVTAVVRRRDIAGIWVAFFARCQRYRCGHEAVSEPGDCLFHDLLCGHCGSTNTSPVPRLAIVGSFTASDEA